MSHMIGSDFLTMLPGKHDGPRRRETGEDGALSSSGEIVACTVESKGRTRRWLEEAVQANPRSERDWLRLAEVVDSDEERRFCLTRVCSINRRNALARRGLEVLGAGPAWSPVGRRRRFPATTEVVTTGQPLTEVVTTRRHRLPWATTEVVTTGQPLVAVGYLVALTIAEVVTTLVEPWVGLLMHGMVLVALLLHTALTWEHPSHRLLLSLVFAPLIRLLSLSLPLSGFPLIYWYLIVSVPLFAATVIALRTLGFPLKMAGLNLKGLPLQMLVALTGLSLGYFEYRILQPAPLVQNLAWGEIWLPGLILVVCTGFAEELIFRGMMQQAATEALGSRWGILYVAILFAVLHVGYQSLADVLFVFGVALFFGLARAVTGSILGVSLAHGMTNVLLFLTIPLGVNYFDIIAYYLYGQ